MVLCAGMLPNSLLKAGFERGLFEVPSYYFLLLTFKFILNMKVRPLHDRVLVERVEAESKTAGGIIIPDNAKEKPAEGRVIAIGNGAVDDSGKRVALDVKVGDRVLFAKWGGTEVKIDGKELIILKESDILAIIES